MVEAEVVAVGLDPTATTSTKWEGHDAIDLGGGRGCRIFIQLLRPHAVRKGMAEPGMWLGSTPYGKWLGPRNSTLV